MADDQAARLRLQKQRERKSRPDISNGYRARIISITSGKGGVGKSNFALNTAIALADMKKKVLLVDADTNLANLDILLGINPRYNLSDVITGDSFIQDIILDGPGGIKILPGSSGVLEMMELDSHVQNRLASAFVDLELEHDYIIIDTGAGLNPHIISFVVASDEVTVITTPEPTAFTDAYAMIKVISHKRPTMRIRLLVNMVKSSAIASEVFDKLNLVVQNYLHIPIGFLGYLPQDGAVQSAVARQVPFYTAYPRSQASAAIRLTTRRLMQAPVRKRDSNEQGLLGKMLTNQKG